MIRSPKLLKAIKSMNCMSCGKWGNTVPAHANWHQYGKGLGIKAHDIFVAATCIDCHDVIDGRRGELSKEEQHDMWHAAWLRTLTFLFQEGWITIK